MRSISPKTAAALKTSTGAAYDAVGGTVQAADLLGVGSPVLSKYASTAPQWVESFIRIDLAIDLDRRSHHPFILTTMAREIGYRLVRETPEVCDLTLSPMGVLKLDRVLDELVHELAAALEDNHISAAERRELQKKSAAVKVMIAKLDAALIGGGE